MKTYLLPAMIFCMMIMNVHASIINVPNTVPNIREAITNAVSGDTIVVAPGTYYENINFRGKNIVLTSMFYLNHDTSYISSTIINGSMPLYPDTGSCVIFNSGEDSSAVLQGFTITGGTGTKWLDLHGAGIYREGGGILVELSSPLIRFNVITNNYATDLTGVQSAGGGGIRVSDGSPIICNNMIRFNHGRYGAGVVLNYTGCTIRNNLIVCNSGGEDYYGGSAIWMTGNMSGFPKVIENNTMVNNSSALQTGSGGVVAWMTADVYLKNNIIYGNYPSIQIKAISSNPTVSYCNVEGGYAGTDNIDADPLFTSVGYFLQVGSPCIDTGDPDVAYNDRDDSSNPGFALFPAMGILRNDIGAYGGAGSSVHPFIQTTTGISENIVNEFSIAPNPVSETAKFTFAETLNDATITLTDISGKSCLVKTGITGNSWTFERASLPSGIYYVSVRMSDHELSAGKLVLQ